MSNEQSHQTPSGARCDKLSNGALAVAEDFRLWERLVYGGTMIVGAFEEAQ
jgi:hypothetical protein